MAFPNDIGLGTLLGFPIAGALGAYAGYKAFDEEKSPTQVVDPYAGMPQYPTYQAAYDPFSMSLQNVPSQRSGLAAFEREALRTGPSPWAGLAKGASRMEQAKQQEALTRQNASNLATAESGLAQAGGLQSGARERLAQAGKRDLLGSSQALAGQGMTNRMQIDINDEINRISQLGQLPGFQAQASEMDLKKRAMDIENILNENRARNAYNMGAYQTQGNIWGAGQQANAISRSGRRGFLGL